jgi:hypothetical protein
MQRYGPDKEEDIGIVLQDLCVVDIDCMGIDREMNVRFPELEDYVREDEERSPLFLQALQTCRRRRILRRGSAHPQS